MPVFAPASLFGQVAMSPALGVETILLPGDSERAMAAEQKVEGIFVEEETWAQIVANAAKVEVEVSPPA